MRIWLKLNFIGILDLLLLILVISFFINDFLTSIFLLIDKIYGFINLNEGVCLMSSNVSTNTQIIHDDGSWSNTVRSIFIYGTGGFRIWMNRASSTPGSRFIIIGTTLFADSASRVVNNIINDPMYVNNQKQGWSLAMGRNGSAHVIPNQGTPLDQALNTVPTAQARGLGQVVGQTASQNVSTSQNIGSGNNMSNNFISIENGLEEILNKTISTLMEYLKPILEPVQVSYSNEVLANQIYGLSVILFILSILIMILLVFFILNILVFIYSDKLMNYFSNKYIKWYININKKFIAIELFFLGTSLLYFMYILSYGIHFIATHPITFT